MKLLKGYGHFLYATQSIMPQNSVPKSYLGEAVLTAATW